MKITTIAALAALLAGAGCGAEEASFAPTQNASTESRGGEPAASYDVRGGTGSVATVNVWSSGAYRATDQRTIVQMGVEVQNRGQAPVTLDTRSSRLEVFNKDGQPLPAAGLVSVVPAGVAQVPANEAQEFELYFALPPPVKPGDIGSLRLRWALAHDHGAMQRYVQFTDFRRQVQVYAGVYGYEPIYGFYDPWWWGPSPVFYRYHVPVQRVIIRHHGHYHHR